MSNKPVPNAINKKDVRNAEKMLISAITKVGPSKETLNNLAIKCQNSPQIKSEVKKAIESNNGNNFKNYESNKIAFSGGDLGLSIGKATNTIISGTKNQNNSWNITVTLQDRYNFEEWRKMNTFGSVANNFGLIAEKTGFLTPYDWDVTFTFVYYEE